MSLLDDRLDQLLAAGDLRPDQVRDLSAAAAADRIAATDTAATDTAVAVPLRSRVVDGLGYAGGALLLGAIAFLGLAFWPDLTRPQRVTVAATSFLVPALASAALLRWRTRPGLTQVLIALSVAAAGFVWTVSTRDEDLVGTSAVVVLGAALAVVLVRSGGGVLAGWVGSMMLVATLVLDVLDRAQLLDDGAGATWTHLAVGFGIVAVAFAVLGLVLLRRFAWALAGLSGWALALVLQGRAPDGEWWSLAVGTGVALVVFAGFVVTRGDALAVVGCLVLVTVWPTSLYRITESELTAALGLLVPAVLLIGSVVVASRRHRSAPGPARQTI